MKIAVIGAGAAGMFAAVCAAERGAEVCLYEHMEEAGKKLLMTGNGKCNLTNLYVDRDCYYSDSDKEDILWQVLDGFTPTDTIAWFQQHGLMTRNRDGYIYPYLEVKAGHTVASTDILIKNVTDNNRSMQIKGVTANATLYIDCAVGSIIDSSGNSYYDKLTDQKFLRLLQGKNEVQVEGDIDSLKFVWNNLKYVM